MPTTATCRNSRRMRAATAASSIGSAYVARREPDKAGPRRPARMGSGESRDDRRGHRRARRPFCGLRLAAAPLGEAEAAHGLAESVRGLPVETAAFEVDDRRREPADERRPLAVDV